MHAAATLELPISAFDSCRDFAAVFKSLPPVQAIQTRITWCKPSFKMPIADLSLRYRKRFRVAIFALLLITPSQSSKGPNGCLEVATALAKNPSLDVLVKEPNFLPNAVKCLQETMRLIGETDWKTVQAMMPPEITKFIHNVGLHIMGNAKAYATRAGLVFMSVYLCYKGAELSAEAKDLALEREKFQEEFDLLEQELIQIKSFIATDIVRQWQTGNTVQMVKNIEKLIEKLDRSFTILTELANQTRQNAKKCASDKVWSVFYGVLATSACAGAICTGNLWVSVSVCGVSISTVYFSYDTFTTDDHTVKKSARLQQHAMDRRIEIVNYRAYLAIVKVKLEMYPEETDRN